MHLHPNTGKHYVAVFPERKAAFAFPELTYRVEAQHIPWLSVLSDLEFYKTEHLFIDNPNIVVLSIDHANYDRNRKYKVVLWYIEALSTDLADLRPEHKRDLDRLLARHQFYDAVAGRSPDFAKALRAAHCPLPVFVMPTGWSPRLAAQLPPASSRKDFAYWGSNVGRREAALPAASLALGDSWTDLTGKFGFDLLRELTLYRAAVYVAHTTLPFGPELRPWQSVTAGHALIVEHEQDMWPFDLGVRRIARFEEDGQAFIKDLRNLLDHDLERAAVQLRSNAEAYTVEKCLEMIPTTL